MSKQGSPYVGPRAFEAGELLFGRDREVRDLVAMLIADRIVLLLSPSGAGKTSLIQARLMKALEDQELHVLPLLRVSMQPRPEEEEALRGANRYLLGALLSMDPERQLPLTEVVRLTFDEILRRRSEAVDGVQSQVMIFDQFEEILTLDPSDQEAKEAFFEQVGAALRNRQRWAVFSMREEYVGSLEPYVSRIPTRLRTLYRLDLLNQVAARLAIQEPARSKGVEFKDAAADILINDLRTMQVQRPDGTYQKQPGPYIEPVQLQVVCAHLWERLPDDARVIDESLVDPIGGGVDAALAGYYSERVSAIAAGDRGKERRIRSWFEEKLITEFGLRGHVFLTPLESEGLDNTTVDALVKAHLVRAESRGSSWYELAHDRLIRPVKNSNAQWLGENLNGFQRQALAWARHGRPSDLLFQGLSLRIAEAWADRAADLTPFEIDYLAACRQERDRKRTQTKLAERKWQLIIVLLALALVSALSIFCWRAYILSTSRERAATAVNQLEGNPDRALELAVEAADLSPTPEAEAALHSALAASRVRRFWLVSVKSGNSVAFSPSGQYLAVAGDAAETALWGARTGERLAPLSGHEEAVTSVAFSGDGRYVATGDTAGRVVLHSSKAPYEHHVIQQNSPRGEGINDLTFSPDGTLLAAATDAPEPILWDVASAGNARQRPVVRGELANGSEQQAVLGVAFNSDGRSLASGGSDGRVVLWDVASPRLRVVKLLARITDPVTGIAVAVDRVLFRPNPPALMTQLAFGTQKGAVWLLELKAGRGRVSGRALFTHTDPVLGLAFSHDGAYLGSSSDDETAKIWDLAAGRELFRLKPSSGPIGGIAFDSSGELIATSIRSPSFSQEGVARVGAIVVWRVLFQDEVPQRSPGDFPGRIIAASYVGTSLVAAGTGSGIAWDAGGHAVANAGCAGVGANPVSAASFSPAGTHLTCLSKAGDIAVVSQPGGAVIRFRHPDAIAAAYHADRRILAAADREGQVALWTLQGSTWVTTPLRPSAVPVNPVPIRALAFSPGGDLLAEGRSDGVTVVLDIASGRSLELTRHEGPVLSLAFSPDGKRLATGSSDQTAKLWDLARCVEVATFQGHWLPVYGVAFTPNGRALATVDSGGLVRIEPLAIDELVRLARDRLQPPRSETIRRMPQGQRGGA